MSFSKRDLLIGGALVALAYLDRLRTRLLARPVSAAAASDKRGASPHPSCIDCGGDLTVLSRFHCAACLADIAWLDEPLTAEERAAFNSIAVDA